MPSKESNPNLYDLFFADGKLKKKAELSDAFIRPVYQYTPQEIRNTQREQMEKELEEYSIEGQINY